MKKLTYAIALSSLLLAGCSQDEGIMESKGELVTLNYNVSLGNDVQSRAAGDLAVNKLLCAVFENGVELKREVIEVTNGTATYKPALFKNIEYKIVFWAYYKNQNDSCYNTADLKNITINDNYDNGVFADDAKKDAFTAIETVTVTGNAVESTVTLTRPFAQINVNTTEIDWNNAEELGSTPTSSKITLTGCATTYDAFNKTWSGSAQNYTFYSVPSVDGYCLASEYVFANGTGTCTIEVYDNATPAKMIYSKEISSFPIEANKRTNVTSESEGGLMTGDVTYKITIDAGLSSTDENKEIN